MRLEATGSIASFCLVRIHDEGGDTRRDLFSIDAADTSRL